MWGLLHANRPAPGGSADCQLAPLTHERTRHTPPHVTRGVPLFSGIVITHTGRQQMKLACLVTNAAAMQTAIRSGHES